MKDKEILEKNERFTAFLNEKCGSDFFESLIHDGKFVQNTKRIQAIIKETTVELTLAWLLDIFTLLCKDLSDISSEANKSEEVEDIGERIFQYLKKGVEMDVINARFETLVKRIKKLEGK